MNSLVLFFVVATISAVALLILFLLQDRNTIKSKVVMSKWDMFRSQHVMLNHTIEKRRIVGVDITITIDDCRFSFTSLNGIIQVNDGTIYVARNKTGFFSQQRFQEATITINIQYV